MLGLLVNGAFRGQRVTGQQRYASEMSAALAAGAGLTYRERNAPPIFSSHKLLIWAWVQSLGLATLRGGYLLTLTSRGPLLARRQVLVVHDLFVLYHPEWFSRAYAYTHAFALRIQLRTARIIVAVSEPVAEQVRSHTHGRVPVVVAPNAPADQFLKRRSAAEISQVLSRFGLERGGYLLTLGGSDPRKNLAMLLSAYAALSTTVRLGTPLVVVGGETDGIFSSMQPIVWKGQAVRVGYVSDSDLAALYQGSMAVLFPSLDEGFGLPAVEAMASGARVIASDIPVLRWVCGSHATYVDPREELLWTAEIARCIRLGPVDAGALSTHRAEAFVKDRFVWARSAAIVVQAISEDISDRKTGLRRASR